MQYDNIHGRLPNYMPVSVVWFTCRQNAELSLLRFSCAVFPKTKIRKISTDLCKVLNSHFGG
jgi:hypothetical protein